MTSDCIDHGGKGNKRGYQTCRHGGRYIGKHVLALIQATGEQPNGRHACHHCDNPRCVNAEHLFWGTAVDNMQDCVRKGRHVSNLCNLTHTANRLRGEANPSARLTEELVRSIRSRYAAGETQVAIAASLDIRQSDVSRIVRRAAWAHVI